MGMRLWSLVYVAGRQALTRLAWSECLLKFVSHGSRGLSTCNPSSFTASAFEVAQFNTDGQLSVSTSKAEPIATKELIELSIGVPSSSFGYVARHRNGSRRNWLFKPIGLSLGNDSCWGVHSLRELDRVLPDSRFL